MNIEKFLKSEAFQNLCTQFVDGVQTGRTINNSVVRSGILAQLERYGRLIIEPEQTERAKLNLIIQEDDLAESCARASNGKRSALDFMPSVQLFQEECKKAFLAAQQPEINQRIEWFLDVRLDEILEDVPALVVGYKEKKELYDLTQIRLQKKEGLEPEASKNFDWRTEYFLQKMSSQQKAIMHLLLAIDDEYKIWKNNRPEDLELLQKIVDRLVDKKPLSPQILQDLRRATYEAFVAQIVFQHRVNHPSPASIIGNNIDLLELYQMANEKRAIFTSVAISSGLSGARAQEILYVEAEQRARKSGCK